MPRIKNKKVSKIVKLLLGKFDPIESAPKNMEPIQSVWKSIAKVVSDDVKSRVNM
jgi:hypothetical protein